MDDDLHSAPAKHNPKGDRGAITITTSIPRGTLQTVIYIYLVFIGKGCHELLKRIVLPGKLQGKLYIGETFKTELAAMRLVMNSDLKLTHSQCFDMTSV